MDLSNMANGHTSRLRRKVLALSAISTLGGACIANAAVIVPSGNFVGYQPFGGQSQINPGAVRSGDTFNIDVIGITNESAGTVVYAPLAGPIDPVFGTTVTSTVGTVGGQSFNVSSSEVVGATTTTDTFKIYVASNFAPTGTTIGTYGTVDAMEMDLGGYTAGIDTVDFSSPVLAASYTGSQLIYGTSSTLSLTSSATINAVFTNGNESLATAEGASAGGATSIEGFGFKEFDLVVTYANPVPEPATAGLLLTSGGLALLKRRARR